jgi:hypothetical protein
MRFLHCDLLVGMPVAPNALVARREDHRREYFIDQQGTRLPVRFTSRNIAHLVRRRGHINHEEQEEK